MARQKKTIKVPESRNVKEEIQSEQTQHQIECSLIPITKSTFSINESLAEKKFGLYSGSVHRVKDFGIKKWVVHFYLQVDYEKQYSEFGLNEKQLIDGCLNYLNNHDKKKVKKEYKPKFGYLQPLVDPATGDYSIAYKPDRIVVSAITDERENPNFWYEGMKL